MESWDAFKNKAQISMLDNSDIIMILTSEFPHLVYASLSPSVAPVSGTLLLYDSRRISMQGINDDKHVWYMKNNRLVEKTTKDQVANLKFKSVVASLAVDSRFERKKCMLVDNPDDELRKRVLVQYFRTPMPQLLLPQPSVLNDALQYQLRQLVQQEVQQEVQLVQQRVEQQVEQQVEQRVEQRVQQRVQLVREQVEQQVQLLVQQQLVLQRDHLELQQREHLEPQPRGIQVQQSHRDSVPVVPGQQEDNIDSTISLINSGVSGEVGEPQLHGNRVQQSHVPVVPGQQEDNIDSTLPLINFDVSGEVVELQPQGNQVQQSHVDSDPLVPEQQQDNIDYTLSLIDFNVSEEVGEMSSMPDFSALVLMSSFVQTLGDQLPSTVSLVDKLLVSECSEVKTVTEDLLKKAFGSWIQMQNLAKPSHEVLNMLRVCAGLGFHWAVLDLSVRGLDMKMFGAGALQFAERHHRKLVLEALKELGVGRVDSEE